ncbi:hypothetical protein [Rhizobium ruizarguesonis]|uniref:hypothetical protein n=1 Tax=Rhizobium ruizarguesonis TaxID=2081791 RepID=UPI0010326A8F|nr:hypothetical protein [Rhizobium ruizarguesonis]TAU25550.1 hypothetical protein ELI48_04745 [Rhizobium ruizarguesonis]TAW01988.1 hypothetical protein ELI25_37700 [Rhizobium ruizarguesonis]TAW08791.1 hypothetical protein ELI26_03870 [Rhizobium ruizarguesonis]TAW97256.1 hypothetical protein ELI12_03955 [Rhizobium ruizarguesonis]TAZ43489.1 hypothetical protein ELH76_37785 [Rhizobium ruizarguesonis]
MTIVYIDDSPSEFMSLADGGAGAIKDFAFENDGPNEEAFAAAQTADVWLFDFFLVKDPHDENGLSLFQKWKATIGGRPTTVVISSDIEKAVGEPLGPVERHHVVAQKHGVEWLGKKTKETLDRVIELGDAADFIAKRIELTPIEGKQFGTYDPAKLCFDVLNISRDAEWANSAMRQIDRARPPREISIASSTTAQSIVGWLLSHVLPYPSFLLTDRQAALRLELTPESFRAITHAVASSSGADTNHTRLNACRYNGPLSKFLGPRWWRAAIDDLAWHLSQDSAGFRPALQQLSNTVEITWLTQSEAVLISDADLVETDEIAEASDCVRVTDEDFPANIDPAWVRVSSARADRKLAAKVIFEDRELLEVAE